MNKLAALLAVVAFVAVGCGGDERAGPAADQETVASGQVPFDQAFIDAMVPHHREAIEMAKAAKSRGLGQADLEEIANDIITSQQREIDEMLDWRQQWFGSRNLGPVLPAVLGVQSELGIEHGSADEVAGAVDVDATFAETMIAHHQGAIAMASRLRTADSTRR
jgi:uncharacterized protein (DUF305 family)